MCSHSPRCPSSESTDRSAAHVVATHPEQGWSLLCNGVVLFEDCGALLPDGSAIAPLRSPRPPVISRELISHGEELYSAAG
jgi:hypothetical protein